MIANTIYITSNEMIELFGQQELLDAFEVDSSEELAASSINKYIESATAIIDAHISVRYETPLSEPIPSIVKRIAAAIVRYDYHNFDTRERVEGAYREALRFLRYLRDGKIDLNSVRITSQNSPRFIADNSEAKKW